MSVALSVSLGLLVLTLFFINVYFYFKDKSTSEYSSSNWMINIPDERPILLINIPGAHDSASKMPIYLEEMAQTQNLTILELLNAGIRKLDIRVDSFTDVDVSSDLDLHICHGVIDSLYLDEKNITRNLTYKHILLDVKKFLSDNPSEMVIFETKSERGNNTINYNRAWEIMNKYAGDMIVNFNKSSTLGQVRGKIVTTFYKLNDDINSNDYHNGIDGGTGLGAIHDKFTGNDSYSTWKVSGDLKIKEIQEFWKLYNNTIEDIEDNFEELIDDLPYTYSISCTGEHETILPYPKNQSDIVNKFILENEFIKGNYYGWINMDFATKQLAKKFIQPNFIE